MNFSWEGTKFIGLIGLIGLVASDDMASAVTGWPMCISGQERDRERESGERGNERPEAGSAERFNTRMGLYSMGQKRGP